MLSKQHSVAVLLGWEPTHQPLDHSQSHICAWVLKNKIPLLVDLISNINVYPGTLLVIWVGQSLENNSLAVPEAINATLSILFVYAALIDSIRRPAL